MDLGLKGKVALVTASSEGLGLACALRLAEAGCSVAICARRPDVLQHAQNEIKSATGSEVLAVPADLTEAEAIQSLVKTVHAWCGRIDVLVANTGHIPYGGLFELDDSQWHRAFDLLLMSMIRLSRHIVPIMQQQGKGYIVFISSAVAKEPSPHLLLSNVLRVGVVALAKSLSQSLAADNIRVNTVTPGYFDTGRVRTRIDKMAAKKGIPREAVAHDFASDIPLGRLGNAEELADLVAFLVSRRAEFLTGSTIQIDGGKAHGIF
jgi:3-oxoacyl-[acyl-carrier protein] reductase